MQKLSDNQFIILASKSPRRKYLLKQAGLSFTVIPSSIDENSIPISQPEIYVRTLAEAKANDISKKYPESWVIGADTIVLIDGIVLGKPSSKTEARVMLKRLSGQIHQVLTGYSICCMARNRFFSETIITEVLFKNLTNDEIEWYINTDEPFDKAGAYAIQGLGTFLVKSINGSYTNVVGLPVCEVIELLIKEGIIGLINRNHGNNLAF
ncbi:MAG: Maf family protein [Deltaproteobacteria bacterium]|jgi:septum formation protein|nr:Maf family protein [Deltaproteobacteria bacterium]